MKWLKVKNMIKKKISLNDKAFDANGKDRSCKNCNHRPCPEALAKVCHDAFVKGYKRGYKQASDEQKERIDKVLHPVTDPCGSDLIYVFMRDVRAGNKQPFIKGAIRAVDAYDDFDISSLSFKPDIKGDPQQLQIAWCYQKDLVELLGYDKKFDNFERIALDEGWASYPESKYQKNLKEHQAEREQYEKLYNYKEKEDKDVQD